MFLICILYMENANYRIIVFKMIYIIVGLPCPTHWFMLTTNENSHKLQTSLYNHCLLPLTSQVVSVISWYVIAFWSLYLICCTLNLCYRFSPHVLDLISLMSHCYYFLQRKLLSIISFNIASLSVLNSLIFRGFLFNEVWQRSPGPSE